MSGSQWLPVRFKGFQVFAEAKEDGELVVRGGRVTIRYSPGAGRSYSTFAARLEQIPGAKPSTGAAASPSAGSRGRMKSKDAQVLGGTQRDIDDPAHIHLWSDGACSGNPGPAGAGTVLIIDGRQRELSTWLGQGTNNIAELVAVQQGIRALEQPVERTVVVHTDSQYSIGILAKAWKAKANPKLIAEIRRDLEPLPKIVWHWVRGHIGVELNERCDALAREAIATRRSTDRVL